MNRKQIPFSRSFIDGCRVFLRGTRILVWGIGAVLAIRNAQAASSGPEANHAVATAASASGNSEPAQFESKDWELQCDNTGTCRAAGYQAEGDFDHLVSLLIVRAAGPRAPLKMTLQTGDESPAEGRLRISVAGVAVDGLRPAMAHISPLDSKRLLPALLRASSADVSTPASHWTLSLAGLNAVLLKMDEAQGRLDTPGALIRKGHGRSEASVPGPVAAPVIDNRLPVHAKPGDTALAPQVFAALDLKDARENCNDGDKLSVSDLHVRRLTDNTLLASLECGTGAYNAITYNWLVADAPPWRSTAIDADGDFDARDGSIKSVFKGRGIADCISSTTWHLTPGGFVKTAASGDGMCRGFGGGAWDMPSYVTRLAHPPTKAPTTAFEQLNRKP